MKPLIYILSLILATVGMIGLQVGMPDTLAIAILWVSLVVTTFSAGWRVSKQEKFLAIAIAALVAIDLAPLPNEAHDRLYLFKLSWFILPVWGLLMIHSVSRIGHFCRPVGSRPPQQLGSDPKASAK